MDTNLFRSGFLASPCHGIIDIKCGEYEGFNPQLGEKIFDKTVNSSFMGTGLLEYLWKRISAQWLLLGYRQITVLMQQLSLDLRMVLK